MRQKPQERSIDYNVENDPKRVHGYKGVRWVENAARGLRRVGFSDEIVRRINHKGWFIHDDDGMSGEVYRGVVYQLPARHSLPQYVIGYADPYNDGAALISFFAPFVEKEDAARSADRFAEIFAEHERDYDRAWQAGEKYRTLADDIASMRSEALEIGRELRANKGVTAPASCAVLRNRIGELYRQIQKTRKERRELHADYGKQNGFQG